MALSHSPHGARVSGVVEETPGRLEYEVALYKEAPTRVGAQGQLPPGLPGELPVDQAVPIGTKLQLRARINPDSGTVCDSIALPDLGVRSVGSQGIRLSKAPYVVP